MIHTENFKTKTVLVERKNPTKERWNIGLDIGYSAVKGFSPNAVYCFPAFAKKVTEIATIRRPNEKDIQYRDDMTGEIWDVGESAQDRSTTNDNELNVYGRVRYFNEMFKVIAEVGMAFGMLKNNYGAPIDKEIFLQTGLPPEYRKRDEEDLKEALSGQHTFSIKIGKRDWISFDFELDTKHIGVIDQPMGTLLSVSTASNGHPSADAARFFSSNVLIMDAGFGTLDIYNISKGKILTTPETIDDMGMKRVFKEVIHQIFDKYKKEITILGMQNVLASGKISILNKKERKSSLIDISDILEECNKKVCLEALNRICNSYDNLADHNYLIITGGTCSAWSNIIREFFSGMKETLTVLSGAQNDNLSSVFANARGYYMYALNQK